MGDAQRFRSHWAPMLADVAKPVKHFVPLVPVYVPRELRRDVSQPAIETETVEPPTATTMTSDSGLPDATPRDFEDALVPREEPTLDESPSIEAAPRSTTPPTATATTTTTTTTSDRPPSPIPLEPTTIDPIKVHDAQIEAPILWGRSFRMRYPLTVANAERAQSHGTNVVVLAEASHSTLIHTIIHGTTETVVELARQLLAEDPHAATRDRTDEFNSSALHIAATWTGTIAKALCEALVECGADLEAEDDKGYRPLHYAAIAGSADAIEVLVQLGANINSRTQFGSAPIVVFWLNLAFERQHDRYEAPASVQCVDTFLRLGADAMAADNLKHIALFFAVMYGCFDAIRLLAARSDLRYRADGFTVLHFGVMTEAAPSLELLQLLLEYDIIRNELLNFICPEFRVESPLQMAVWLGRYTFAKYLLQQGADPNFMIPGSNTAVHLPANIWFGRRHDEIIQVEIVHPGIRGSIHKLRYEPVTHEGRSMWFDLLTSQYIDAPPSPDTAVTFASQALIERRASTRMSSAALQVISSNPDAECPADEYVLDIPPRHRFEFRVGDDNRCYWRDHMLNVTSFEPPPSEIAQSMLPNSAGTWPLPRKRHVPAIPTPVTHRTRMMYLLLMYKGDPNLRTADNLFPLYLAAEYNLAGVITVLLAFGAKRRATFLPPDHPPGMRPITAKTMALRLGNKEAAEALSSHRRKAKVAMLPTGKEGVHNRLRPRCASCRTRIGLREKKEFCRSCKHSMCKQCFASADTKLLPTLRHLGAVPVCLSCARDTSIGEANEAESVDTERGGIEDVGVDETSQVEEL